MEENFRLNQMYGVPLPQGNGYRLDPKEDYVISVDNEKEIQSIILSKILYGQERMSAISDYLEWLERFNEDPGKEISKSLLEKHHMKKPLWETENSIALVARTTSGKYCIIAECSSKSEETFRGDQVIVYIKDFNSKEEA